MGHVFFCGKCGKRFDVNPALIGKRARCGDCQHVFLIPDLEPAPAAQASAYRSEHHDPPPSPPPAVPSFARDLLAEQVLPERPGKPVSTGKKRRRRSGDECYLWVGSATLCGAIAGGVFVVIWLLARAGGSESLSVIGIGGIGFVGIALCMLGNLICLITPFRESFVCGLLYIFMPFYHLYYLITRWEAMKRPFIMILAGMPFWLITVVSILNSRFFQDAMAQAGADLDRAAQLQPPEPAPLPRAPGPGPAPDPLPAPDPAGSLAENPAPHPVPVAPPRPPLPRARGPMARAPSPPPDPDPILPPGPAGGTDQPSGDARTAQLLDDLRSTDRRRRAAALKALSEPAAAPAIAEFLGTPRSAPAIAALQALGSAVEEVVIPCLRSDNWFARKDACQVLRVIGTEKSVPELTVIAEHQGLSTHDAQQALQEIARRQGAPDRGGAGRTKAQRWGRGNP
jgi:hypothetical protein